MGPRSTRGGAIVNLCFYNIGSTSYAIAFKADGSAVQIELDNGNTTVVGTAGTFFAAGNPTTPAIAQFSNSGILIVSQVSANAYWAWDGTLHSPGDATSPTWLNGGTPTAMPMGVAGADIEIFLSRIWIVGGTNILTSAPSNGATFSAGRGRHHQAEQRFLPAHQLHRYPAVERLSLRVRRF